MFFQFPIFSLYCISMSTSLCIHKKGTHDLCSQLFFQVDIYIYVLMCCTYIIVINFNLVMNIFSVLRLFAGNDHKIIEQQSYKQLSFWEVCLYYNTPEFCSNFDGHFRIFCEVLSLLIPAIIHL